MPHKLINHSPDLKQLWDEGLELEIRDGFLLVHHVPYLNSAKEIKYGTLVSTLNLAGDKAHTPEVHTTYFAGDAPCSKDGSEMSAIINSSATQHLASTITVHHYLSTKPKEGAYVDYYQKMTTYINLLSAPAKSLDDTVTEKTYRIIEPEESDSVFCYVDSNSARAEINNISKKLENQKIAIIGLGGTGSYLLDFLAKTPVKEIHIFDGDVFLQHNAFRAPGAPPAEKLRERMKKTDYLQEIYSRMHRHIYSHPAYIDASNMDELQGMDFIFICLDKGEIKKSIMVYLEKTEISFIDVGMGILNIENELIGQLRVTSSTKGKRDHIAKRVTFTEAENNEYSKNIQIADLNALNASLAVIKWKKLYNFYQDLDKEYNTTYVLNTGQLLNDDNEA